MLEEAVSQLELGLDGAGGPHTGWRSLCALACLSEPYREDLLGSVLSELYSGRIKRAITPP